MSKHGIAVLFLTGLLPLWALAAPGRAPELDTRLRRASKAVVRSARAAGKSPLEVRGKLQEALIEQVKQYRARAEINNMRAAGLKVSYKDVRAFVDREFESFLGSFERPSEWDSLSPGKQFSLFFKAARRSFATQRTFPSNWQLLDGDGRFQALRCIAGSCSATQAPAELAKWLDLTGTAAPASARPLSPMEQMLRTRAGGAQPPRKVYYGKETAAAIKNFNFTDQRVPMDLIVAVAEVKAAAARANMRTGRLDRKIGEAIITAAEEIKAGKFNDQFPTDPIQGGAGTSINMNVNEVIAGRASELLTGRIGHNVVHPNDHVNMAQSTNDVIPAAARVAIYRRLESLLGSYELLTKELQIKALQTWDVPKAGRTHLQDAVPIMMGREFKAYAEAVKRDMRDIRAAMRGLTSVNLGGTAVGTALNAEPAYVRNVARDLAKITGVPTRRARDLVDATQNVDALTRAHAALKVSSSNLIKICNDLRMMNSGPRAGFGEITLAKQQAGSSIMPGKVNPVGPEALDQIGYQVQGNDVTVNLVAQNGQLELNQMQPVMIHNILSSIQLLDRGTRALATRSVHDLRVNEQNCRRGAEQMLGLATALVPKLGYEKSAALANRALETGQSLRDVVVESRLLSAKEADRLLDPARMARGGVL